jgi:thiamine-monophosphate kinase
VHAVHESAVIQLIASRVGTRTGVDVGIGDDAAVIACEPPLVAAHDMVVEDVHFRWGTSSPADVGHTALAVNLSDVAAMGARPVAALVGLAAGPDLGADRDPSAVVAALYGAMEELAAATGCTIAGGDTSSAAVTMVGVTVIGRMDPGVPPVLRSGGRPGDLVCVTGALGASWAGLALLRGDLPADGVPEAGALRAAHRRPRPRTTEGPALASLGVAAMMDCSDGLAIDLERLARASGVSAVLDLDSVPVAAGVAGVAAALGRDPAEAAATGGEDYELVVALPEALLPHCRAALGTPLTVVGRLDEGPPALRVVRGATPATLETLGWEHRV